MNHNNFYTAHHIPSFVLTYYVDEIYENTTAGNSRENSHIYNFLFDEFSFNYMYYILQYYTADRVQTVGLSERISLQLF